MKRVRPSCSAKRRSAPPSPGGAPPPNCLCERCFMIVVFESAWHKGEGRRTWQIPAVPRCLSTQPQSVCNGCVQTVRGGDNARCHRHGRDAHRVVGLWAVHEAERDKGKRHQTHLSHSCLWEQADDGFHQILLHPPWSIAKHTLQRCARQARENGARACAYYYYYWYAPHGAEFPAQCAAQSP